MKSHRLDIIIGVALLAGMLSMVATIVYWLVRPYNILEYHIDNYEMQQESYKVGEPFTYRTAFTKRGDLEATVIRVLQEGVMYSFPVTTAKTPGGDYDFISTSNVTPNVPEGEYRFVTKVIYKPNPLRTIEYTMESESFIIIREE